MTYIILYALWCVFWAYANYRAIDVAEEHIFHGANGFMHIMVAVYFGLSQGWITGLCILLVARLFFDISLNLFRGKGVGYVSPNPRSMLDKAEKFVFKEDGITPKIIYACTLIVLCLI
jgi:hypothetical protein